MAGIDEKGKRLGRRSSVLTACNINKDMLLPKAAYFFCFACYGMLITFNTMFLTDVGLSPKQAGFVNGIKCLPMVLGSIIFCFLADRTQKHRIVVCCLIVAAAAFLFPMPWVAMHLNAKLDGKHVNHFNFTKNVSKSLTFNSSSRFVTHTAVNSTVMMQRSGDDEGATLYLTMMLMNILAALCYGPFVSFTDIAVTAHVKKSPTATTLSKQIRFMSLGWGIAPAIAGALANYLPLGNLSPFSWVFILYTAWIWFFCLILYILYAPKNFTPTRQTGGNLKNAYNATTISKRTTSHFHDLLETMTNLHVLFFYFTILLLTAGYGVQGGYLLILLDELGASNLNKGLTSLFDQGGEFILCSFVDVVIRYAGGEMRALVISYFLLATRSILFSSLHNPWLVHVHLLATSLFQPLFVTSGLQITTRIAPAHLKGTLVSFFNAAYTTGTMTGNLIGAVIYEKYGGAGLFRYTSITLASWAMVLFIYTMVYKMDKLDDQITTLRKLEVYNGSDGAHHKSEEVHLVQ